MAGRKAGHFGHRPFSPRNEAHGPAGRGERVIVFGRQGDLPKPIIACGLRRSERNTLM